MRRIVLSDEAVARIESDTRFVAAREARGRGARAWRADGACHRVADPDMFFPQPTDDPTPALRVCHTCPVLGPCLASALDTGDVDGVWGAATFSERRQMRVLWRKLPVPSG